MDSFHLKIVNISEQFLERSATNRWNYSKIFTIDEKLLWIIANTKKIYENYIFVKTFQNKLLKTMKLFNIISKVDELFIINYHWRKIIFNR